MRDYIINRLGERSTWAGLAALAVLLGIAPEKVQALEGLGVALGAALSVFVPTSKPAAAGE